MSVRRETLRGITDVNPLSAMHEDSHPENNESFDCVDYFLTKIDLSITLNVFTAIRNNTHYKQYPSI